MDWSAQVDLYCERLGAAFWAEPVNALSNLSFLLAALIAWQAARARPDRALRPVEAALIPLAALIGVGSFLFHTFATRWAEPLDSGPIWLFVGLYVFAAITAFAQVPSARQWRIGAIIGLVVVGVLVLLATGEDGASNATDPLNGSGQYAPALAALVILSALMARRGHPMTRYAVAGTLVFLASLALRTLDRPLCAAWPLGTHFGWHLLNGLLVGLLLVGLIRTAPARQLVR